MPSAGRSSRSSATIAKGDPPEGRTAKLSKDLRFGMGLSSTRIGEPTRRDRLLLVSAFATALLTLLGQVGERLGMDRLLKSNTGKTRSHSLFRHGCMLYELMPTMPEHRLKPLVQHFDKTLSAAPEFGNTFAAAK